MRVIKNHRNAAYGKNDGYEQLSISPVPLLESECQDKQLLNSAKIEGSSWLAAGTLQALNAAYMTRVIGRSMADWLAMNNGVSEPDLDALKIEASKLIEVASQQERVDWSGFLKQSSAWLGDRKIPLSLNSSIDSVS